VARILLTILLIIRILGGLVFILTSWGTAAFMFGIFLDMGLAIIVLLLLFNHQSNEFFTDEVKTR
jgi:Na+-driven multidrug efflux pump